MMELTDLEWRVLNICCGGIENMSYDSEHMAAEHSLEEKGLIKRGYDDDQPTAWPTDKGRAMREAIIAMGLEKVVGFGMTPYTLKSWMDDQRKRYRWT